MSVKSKLLAIAVLMSATVSGCAQRDVNFSQHPGFASHFAAQPRGTTLPSSAERALLERHRPRLMLPHGHPGPIDFYGDYIAQGSLHDGAGRLVSSDVSRELLNRYKIDPRAVFSHRPDVVRDRLPARAFARIDRADVTFPGPAGPVTHAFTFLTYNFVFRYSGLPDWFAPWQMWVARRLGSLEDWHQLDHFTSATLALDETMTPAVLIVQQHNLRRAFILGEWVSLPADGRPVLDVALRSNELYPFSPGGRPYRVVPHLSADNVGWYLTGGERPRLAGLDATEGWDDEAIYALDYLPHDDAFYAFEGFLGERRFAPGRDGPPGADFNVWPSAKPWPVQLMGQYWHDGDAGDLAKFRAAFARAGDASGDVYRHMAEIQGADFYRMWRCIRSGRRDCGVRS